MKKMIGIFLLLYACSGSGDKETYAESAIVHNEAINIGEKVDQKIAEIEAHKEKYTISSRLLDSLLAIQEDFREWQSNLVEVPGHKHDHSGHSHHGDHDHGSENNLTPEMMLLIQTELRNQINELNDRAQNLLELTKKETDDKPDKK